MIRGLDGCLKLLVEDHAGPPGTIDFNGRVCSRPIGKVLGAHREVSSGYIVGRSPSQFVFSRL